MSALSLFPAWTLDFILQKTYFKEALPIRVIESRKSLDLSFDTEFNCSYGKMASSPNSEKEFYPNVSNPTISKPQSANRSLHSPLSFTRSISDGHGFTYFRDEDRALSIQDPEKADGSTEETFEVTWDGDDDPLNPRSFGHARKWVIVLIVSMSSLCVTCTSSLYTSTYGQITQEFHVSEEVATLGLSLFVMGLGIGPMVLGPLSEFYGRRPIYIVSFALFLIWIIPCAVAKNIATELVARFINGLVGAAFLSVAGGTVGDMFSRNELQAPMMVYTASPFLGPEVGPIVGGFINQYTSWYDGLGHNL